MVLQFDVISIVKNSMILFQQFSQLLKGLQRKTLLFLHWMVSTYGTPYLKVLLRQEQRFCTTLI